MTKIALTTMAAALVLAGCSGGVRSGGPSEPYFFAPAGKDHAAISAERGCPAGALWVGTKRTVAGVPDPECK